MKLSFFIQLSLCLVVLSLFIQNLKCDQQQQVHKEDKYVMATLNAKWSETPFLLEASEYIYRINPKSFWLFLKKISKERSALFYDLDNEENKLNSKEYLEKVLSVAKDFLSPIEFDLLRLSLSLRTYSPAIEMSRKLARDSSQDLNCLTFVDVQGQISCDLNKIEDLIKNEKSDTQRDASQQNDVNKQTFLYQHDKHYDFGNEPEDTQMKIERKSNLKKVIIILYAQIGTQEFDLFHTKIINLIASLSSSFQIDYILRHNCKEINDLGKVALSGYGVELDIKNVEYKAADDSNINAGSSDTKQKSSAKSSSSLEEDTPINGFMFNKLKSLNPSLSEQLDELRKHLIESTFELAPLKAWQMQDLSLQAAQSLIDASIDSSENVLNILEDLSQNYPIRARSLSKIKVRTDLKKTFKSQRGILEKELQLEQGQGSLYLNGLDMGSIDSLDIFQMSSMLKKEARLLESFNQIGLNTEQIKDLIYLSDSSSKSNNNEYGIDIRDSSIQWLNDLEQDSKYSYWTREMQEILRPTYPGMMRPIARNFYHLVFILDPALDESKRLLSTAESFYVNDIPLKIGFVFVTNDKKETDGFKEANVALFRAHNYIVQNQGRDKALSFITDVYSKSPKNTHVTSDLVVKEFKKKFPKEANNLEDIFGVDSDYDEGRLLTMDYYRKIGLKSLPIVVLNGYLLKENELEDDAFEESVITKVMQYTSDIQMSVYKGIINDRTVLLDWLMNKDTIMPRLNPRVLATPSNRIYMDETKHFAKYSNDITNDLKYYLLNENEKVHALTLWIVCDPDTPKGRELLFEAINFYESSKIGARLALVLNVENSNSNGEEDSIIKRAIYYALNTFQNDKIKATNFIKKLLREKTYGEIKNKKISFGDLDFISKEFSNLNNIDALIKSTDVLSIVKKHQTFLQANTPFKDRQGSIGLIANGWVLGPFDENETFIDNDFTLLENFVQKIGLKQIKDLVKTKWSSVSTNQDLDDLIVKVNCIIGKDAAMASSSTSNSEELSKRHKLPIFTTGIVNVKPRRPDMPYFDVVAIIDPLSRHSQKVSTILKVLSQITNINLVIYFNCKDKLSAPPLKSFYRYVLETEIRFGQNGNRKSIIKPLAYFHNMPQTPILTMNIHSPESWMVEAVNSPFDLDNICLKDIGSENRGVFSEYELEHLIVEGHAFDVQTSQSPRGLQFNLGTLKNMFQYDTIVMANLGYFQLKASPGMWILQLREGKSKDIYEIVSHENTDSQTKKSPTIFIVIDSFEAKVIRVKVSKKADKITENLLDDGKDDASNQNNERENSIWNSFGFGGSDDGGEAKKIIEESKEKSENILNIFSVASGHLYERLLRIMMLTVLKNTQAKVKFWFLKNYLSPQFTQFLPYYAKEYNFTYELVQYKWPRWLHHESEKQRIIWGYKILFLDVLFPLNIEKIIYVDADQIVRADLTELRDLDLKGAPYGYTPFCDSRKEMDGYRFWKSGYWQMHLGHRKYHISALYVVDLKKFRKIAAGDRLRGQYQGLSQDPNSLSNLDQDLPNNMIHQVNIFSLPQEWLYCDTWCSSDTLSKAKTIDLCNNPQTKEPKLSAAVRIAPEWRDLDTEIKNVISKWQTNNSDSQDRVIIDTSSTNKHHHTKEDL